MKASKFIEHLQQMIEEHGDLPLAMLEVGYNSRDSTFIESDGVEVFNLDSNDTLINEWDEPVKAKAVFLID